MIGIAAGMYESGQEAANQVLAKNSNIRNAVVPNHAVGHVGLEAMAAGYIDTIVANGGTAEQIVIGADTGQNTATLVELHAGQSHHRFRVLHGVGIALLRTDPGCRSA